MTPEDYNRIRRILFCTVHDYNKGFKTAFNYLDRYYRDNKLDYLGYTGLKAELYFYQDYREEYNLTVAGDMGEHADFAGKFDSNIARFDVTTNINFKYFEDYEPYIGNGIKYKIAILDKDNFKIIDVLDLAFKRCEICGNYIIPSIIMLNQNYTRHDEPDLTYDQLLINACECQEVNIINRFTHYMMPSPSEKYNDFGECWDDYEIEKNINEYYLDIYTYFRTKYSKSIMAIGENNYITTNKDGDGYWAINFNFVNKAIIDIMPTEIFCDPNI